MAELQDAQLEKLNHLLAQVIRGNKFYAPRLVGARLDEELPSIDLFKQRMPLTTKQELIADQLANPPYGTNLTHQLSHYSRYCQTSGTTGTPMRWLDTPISWQWMLDSWKQVFQAADVSHSDTVFCAFSFGPFLGFWSAFEAAVQLNCLCIPGGGMSSVTRLQTILDNHVTVLCCTPTYAAHLGRAAMQNNIDLSASSVRAIIVGGEPGGSLPTMRSQIERAWPDAHVYDHHGMTEVGPVSFQLKDMPDSLQIIETAYIAEVIDPDTLEPVERGQTGELILTTLGRIGSPLLRYRTGDLVRQADDDDRFILEGGILSRADDMIQVRGVNVFPSAVDEVVRRYAQISEYQVHVDERGEMTQLHLVIEPNDNEVDMSALCVQLEQSLRDAFNLRIPVQPAQTGELPRFELKAKRWIRM